MAGTLGVERQQVQQKSTTVVNPNEANTNPKAPGAGVKLGKVGSPTIEVRIADAGNTNLSPTEDLKAPVINTKVNRQSASQVAEAKIAAQDKTPVETTNVAKKSVDDVVAEQTAKVGTGVKEISDVDVKALAKKENLDETALTAALTKAGF